MSSSILMRRDRLERIAMAERDRRAGRCEVAIASLGEATEWPARVILALAKMPEGEASEAKRILEEGLDLWAEESELDGLDAVVNDPDIEDYVPPIEASASDLERPIDNSELDRAFEDAEAQVEEMHDVNQVAARVLMDESIGLAALAGDDLVPVGVGPNQDSTGMGDEMLADVFGMDAAAVPPPSVDPPATHEVDGMEDDSRPSPSVILGTLSRWLGNIQAGNERRAQ